MKNFLKLERYLDSVMADTNLPESQQSVVLSFGAGDTLPGDTTTDNGKCANTKFLSCSGSNGVCENKEGACLGTNNTCITKSDTFNTDDETCTNTPPVIKP